MSKGIDIYMCHIKGHIKKKGWNKAGILPHKSLCYPLTVIHIFCGDSLSSCKKKREGYIYVSICMWYLVSE